MRFLKGLFLVAALCGYHLVEAQKPVVEEVYIRGNTKTNTNFLRKLVKTESGNTLDSTLLEQDVQMLIRLPSITHAYFQVFYSRDSLYNVYITVEENFTIIPYFNAFNRGEQAWTTIGLSEHNLLGRNMLLDVFYRYNGLNSFGITYRAPFLFNAKWGMGVSYKNFVSDEPVFFDNEVGSYRYNFKVTELLGLYQLTFTDRVELGASYIDERYEYQGGLPDDANPPLLIDFDKYLLKAFYQHYKITQYYQYKQGNIVNVQYQHVQSFANDLIPFDMLDAEYIKLWRIGEKANLGARIKVGVSTNNATPFSAYVIDNQTNVRGVGDRIKRGSASSALNAEYRYTFWENNWLALQGAAFADYANIRLAGADLENLYAAQNNYASAGLGTRFILKRVYSAVFRIDYGFLFVPEQRAGLVLGVGHYF